MAKSKQKVAPKDIDLKHMEKAFLACRDFGHGWDWMTDMIPHRDPEKRKITTVTRVLICLRCGTIRHDEYAVPSFERVKSTYEYAVDYIVNGYKGHVPVSFVRQEIMRRFKAGAWK